MKTTTDFLNEAYGSEGSTTREVRKGIYLHPRGEIAIKNSREMKMYFMEGRKESIGV